MYSEINAMLMKDAQSFEEHLSTLLRHHKVGDRASMPSGQPISKGVTVDQLYVELMKGDKDSKGISLSDIDSSRQKEWELQRLRGVHFSIIRLHCAGLRNVEIAERLGITSATVTNVLNSEVGRQQIAIIQATRTGTFVETQTHIEELAPVAVLTLGNVLLDPAAKHGDKIRAADSLLDRAGFKQPDRTVHEYLSSDDLEDIKKRARQNGILANADATDVEDISNV